MRRAQVSDDRSHCAPVSGYIMNKASEIMAFGEAVELEAGVERTV
jgi:hypothetical protein